MMTEYANIDWSQRLDQAAKVVWSELEPSPLIAIDLQGFDAPAYLKLESMQPTGSFKIRGALAAIAAAKRDGRQIVTVSSGNHALGVAQAATHLGVAVTIVVPENASGAKIAALQQLDVDLRLIGNSYDAAENAAFDLVESTGAHFLSGYTDPDVIAGQSTLVREVAYNIENAFRIVVPVGGGGLASGTALAAPDRATVTGVEAELSRAVSESMKAKTVVDVEIGDTIADGVAGGLAPNSITPTILSEHGVHMSYANESEIRHGVRDLALRHGIVAETSSAIPIAAAQAGRVPADMPAVFVVTGRNIAPDRLSSLLTS